ncbi:MAG: RNA polymerase sigma factor [Thermodesulfobacteriota bacterium]
MSADPPARPASPASTDIAGLVRALRQGDRDAFARLVRLHQARIYNLALGYVKQEDEARDLTQDIFLTVFRRIGDLADENKFSAWLYQLALNHCRNRYRSLSRRGFFNSQPVDDPVVEPLLRSEATPEKALEKKQLETQVRTAIAALSPAEREIVLLRDLQGLSYEEIGDILAIPLGTVKSKLNRARVALASRLKRHGGR